MTAGQDSPMSYGRLRGMPGRSSPESGALDNRYATGILTVPEYRSGEVLFESMVTQFAPVLGKIEELLDFLFGLHVLGCGGKVERMACGRYGL